MPRRQHTTSSKKKKNLAPTGQEASPRGGDGLVGYELSKKMNELAISNLRRMQAEPEVKELVELNSRFLFPKAEKCITPGFLVPAIVDAVIDSVPKCKRGRIAVDGQLTLDKLGDIITSIAHRVAYICDQDQDLVLGALRECPESVVSLLQSPGMGDAVVTMEPEDFIKFCLLTRNLVTSGLNKVRVLPSSVHGNGVFASVNIKKGDVITMYPADYVTAKPSDDLEKRWYKTSGESITQTECEMMFLYLALVENTIFQIAGDPDKYSAASCGHLINDGASLDKPNFTREDMNAYLAKSWCSQNCTFVPIAGCAVAVVATKPIPKDSEVFAAYGVSFWGQFSPRA